MKDSLHLTEQNMCFFQKEPWKQVLQEWGRFAALGEAVRSRAAVTVPKARVRVSAAGTVCTLKGLGQTCGHTELFLLNSQGLSQAIGFAETELE